MRVLIIEDDPAIAANPYDFLEARGHAVDAAGDGVTGLHLAVTGRFDAIVLDVGLPGIDGMTLCRRLREDAHNDTPVLVLTARDTLQDKLEGFARGADDYLVKPFALKEVEARLTALHKRRAGRVTDRELTVGEIVFDPKSVTVRVSGRDALVGEPDRELVPLNHNRDIGLLVGDALIELGFRKTHTTLRYDFARNAQKPGLENEDAVRDTTSLFQVAYELYAHRRYRLN